MQNNIPIFRSDNVSHGVYAGRRIDANEMMFFADELTSHDPKDYEILRAPLTGISTFFEKQVEKYATLYQYNMYEAFGKAKYAGVKTGKADDAPLMNAGGKRYTSPVADIISAIAFSDADILAGHAVRRSVISTLIRQAMQANMELMNSTCFVGNESLGLQGILSNKNVISVNSSKDLTNATVSGTDTLAALSTIYGTALDGSKGLIRPDTLMVSPKIYTNLNLTIGNSFSGANVKTIFENMNNVKIITAPELSKDSGNSKEMAILFKNDPEFIQHVVAETFEVKPPQARGLEYISYCRSSHGGLVIRQPKAVCVVTNTL